VSAEQRLLRAQQSAATAFNAVQCAPESEHAQLAHQTVYRTCPVHHRTAQRPHKSELQRSKPNGWLTWLAHRTLSGGVDVSRLGVPGPTSENVAACPSPDGSARDGARRGEEKAAGAREREVEIPRPSCLSRAQVGCACSRGLQASTRERERAASRERPSRPLPCAANPL
jgi:hypothetical protein